ncbi:uncharacterized protein BDZ83DRAFT_633132 [Colletotrichum acutatum]|uniref:Uncharacterized protein n=1 Tax=Glomerella acutata TaxID=27357 RepID=A0AAD8XDU9_GLOAC|nr:uncharacterized protein BDZ83DRAFT_633132 [Colletotrichum acutatum]KAK1718133.1 hypothetical protein BDZ83DRAFT_633132 [Colletotrichum acutatum]
MNHTEQYLAISLSTLRTVNRSTGVVEKSSSVLLALSPSNPASVRPNRSQSGRSHRKHQRQPKQSRTETCRGTGITISQP